MVCYSCVPPTQIAPDTQEPSDTSDVIGADVSAGDAPCVAVVPLAITGVDFDVPPDALSVHLTATAMGRLTTSTLSVDDEALVKEDWFQESELPFCLSCTVRVGIQDGVHTVQAPNGLPIGLAGAWRWEVAALDGGSPVARAWAKVGSALPATGQLKLAVHYPEGGQEVGLADRVSQILQGAGVTVEVRAITYQPPERVVRGDLSDLTAQSDRRKDEVAVYFVERLEGEDGTALHGLSPVPGPYGDAADHTGVVVWADTPRDVPRVLAHELGHYLGLWHTYEAKNPALKDPLGDTPVGDSNNLMTPGADGDMLSPEQGIVVRGHPAVQHTCELQ